MKAATTSRLHSPMSAASRQRSVSRRSISSSSRSMRDGRFAMYSTVATRSDGLITGEPLVLNVGEPLVPPRAPSFRAVAGFSAFQEPAERDGVLAVLFVANLPPGEARLSRRYAASVNG